MSRNAVAEREPRNNIEAVCRTIDSADMRQRMAQALPENVSIERFTRVVLTAIQQEPALADADKPSLFNSCINAAKDGLLPDKREGALVVYNTRDGDGWVKRVQWLPMVAGVLKRMGEAGIQAYAANVHRNDRIRIWNDADGQHVEHDFDAFGDRGEFIGVYAVAQLKDGRRYIEHMGRDEIDRVMAASKSKDRKTGEPTGPWRDWYDRMAQKSVLHRLGRRVPITIGDDRADRLVSTLRREDEFAQERQVHAAVEALPRGKPATAPPKAIDDAPPADDGEFDVDPHAVLARCASVESVREFMGMVERGELGELDDDAVSSLADAASARIAELQA
jgi:phage RecT family recombinase